jgi:isoleucyl-tRNA synthetase
MPFAQVHFPFENADWFESHYPGDFIVEYIGQTRGWFYTLHILGVALFDKPAFLHNITSGLVLAADGKKMSKSLRNYTDPVEVVNTYGAEALRLFLMRSAATRAEETRFSDEGVRETLKTVIIPLWNAYSFFVTYANIDQASPRSAPENPANPLDRWILSETERLAAEVTSQMERYDLLRAIEPIVEFIDILNNWYIRRSRRRFWRSENDNDKAEAYRSLWHVLVELSKIMAPIMPFVSEAIYRNLRAPDMPESVHLCDYPVAAQQKREVDLELKMKTVRNAVSMGRAIRSMHAIKTRQPLAALYLVTKNPQEKSILLEMEDIIREEINVKEVIFRDNEEDLVEYTAKPNYRVLGRGLGKDMKAAAEKIEALSMGEIASLLEGATLSIDVGGRSLELTAESVEVRRVEKQNLKVLNEGSLTVGLDPEITEDLKAEGVIRDLVRGIQNVRKESGLDVSDRIEIFLHTGEASLREAAEDFQDYLLSETLGASIHWEKRPGSRKIECGGKPCAVFVKKV